jgi:hypothetical protein
LPTWRSFCAERPIKSILSTLIMISLLRTHPRAPSHHPQRTSAHNRVVSRIFRTFEQGIRYGCYSRNAAVVVAPLWVCGQRVALSIISTGFLIGRPDREFRGSTPLFPLRIVSSCPDTFSCSRYLPRCAEDGHRPASALTGCPENSQPHGYACGSHA